MTGPLDIDDDMQRMVLRKGEAFPYDLFELRAGGRCDQRRHAVVHRCAALGPVRPAQPGAGWRPAANLGREGR